MCAPQFGLGTAHVGLKHLRVAGHGFVGALCNHLTALQHGDGVGDLGDHAHVVFDHQDGAIGAHLADQVSDPVNVFVPHALGGLIEQHQLRLERERGRNLERALAPVWQLDRHGIRKRGQIHRRQQLERLARGLLILALGVEGLRLTGDPSASLRQWNLVVKQLSRINSNFAEAILHSSIYESFIKLLHVQTSTWIVIFAALFLYGLLICVEGVGLWFDVLWAEKLTVISTSAFIPLEIYELAKGFAILKLAAFGVNIFLVIKIHY